MSNERNNHEDVFDPLIKRLKHIDFMRKKIEALQKEDDFTPTSPLNVIHRLRLRYNFNGSKEYVNQDEVVQRILFEGVRRLAELSYATVIIDYMEAVAVKNDQDVYINLTEPEEEQGAWEIVEQLFVDPNEELWNVFEHGKRQGIQKVLELLSGQQPLLLYRRDLFEKTDLLPDLSDNGGVSFVLPTCLEKVSVDYFYPEDEMTPTVALILNKI